MAGLKRIADIMSAAGSKMAKPAESEASGIKAIGDAENEYLNAVKATMPSSESEARPEGTSADHVNSMAKYGDRGTEERIDTSSYTKPLAGTPVYDRGGMVGEQPRDVIQDPQMDTNRIYEQQDHRMRPMSHSDEPVQLAQKDPIAEFKRNYAGNPEDKDKVTLHQSRSTYSGIMPPESLGHHIARNIHDGEPLPGDNSQVGVNSTGPYVKDGGLPNRYLTPDPTGTREYVDPAGSATSGMPVYDQGGLIGDDPLTMSPEDKPEPFNMTDGKHQEAIVENGERVLTPEQNAQYEKEHNAWVGDQMVNIANKKEEHGAPSDFSGPVYSNPHGLKPMSDTDAPPAEPLSGGAKMDISNAGPSEGITGPQGPHVTEASAKMKPMAGTPNDSEQPTAGPAGAPEAGPATAAGAPTPGEPVHPFGPQMTGVDEYHAHLRDLKNEMETGFQNKDYVKAGNAKLALNELEKANPRGSEYNHPGLLGKIEHGLSLAGQAAANTVVGPQLTALIPGTQTHMNLEARQGEQLAGEGVKRGLETEQTAVAHKAANAPDPIDQQLAQAQSDQLAHPTPEGAAKVKGLQDIIDKGKVPPVDKLNQQLFDAEQTLSNMAPGDPKRAAQEQTIANLKDSINQGKNVPAGTAEANLEKTQNVFKQMEQKGYDVTDPKHQTASIKKALAKGDISAEQASEAQSYLATHAAAPATSVTVAGEKTAQNQAIKDAAKTYAYTDENNVRHWAKGDKLPAGIEATEIKNPQQELANAHAGNIIQDSLNKLHKDIDDAPVIFDDAAARAVLATATDSGKASKLGLYVPGVGGVGITAPAGSSKAIDALLENNAIHGDEAKALKRYISDYIYAKEQAGKMLIEGQGGKMGRMNALAYSALIDQLPGGGTPDSAEAIHRMQNLETQHAEFSDQYPDKYDNFTKMKPYAGKSSTGASPTTNQNTVTKMPAGVPPTASHVYYKAGQPHTPENVAGYALDGQYHAIGGK